MVAALENNVPIAPALSGDPLKALWQQLGLPENDALMKLTADFLTSQFGSQSDDSQQQRKKEVRLRQRFMQLQRENSLLEEQNDLCAAALGACSCWGTDDSCKRCAGQGIPGYFIPDEEAFGYLLLPLFDSRGDLILGLLKNLRQCQPDLAHSEKANHTMWRR